MVDEVIVNHQRFSKAHLIDGLFLFLTLTRISAMRVNLPNGLRRKKPR